MGSILGVAITVALIASAVALTPEKSAPPDLHPVGYLVDATEGKDALTLIHTGGLGLDIGNTEVVVEVDSVEIYRSTLGPSGLIWNLGDQIIVGPLSQRLPASGHIEVKLLRTIGNEASIIYPINRYELASFDRHTDEGGISIIIAFSNLLNHTEARGTEVVFVEAFIAHPEGRKLIRTVTGRIEALNLGWTTLHDDGTHGDVFPGDGIYSAELTLPIGTPLGTYPLTIVAVDLYGNRATATASVKVGPTTIVVAPSQPAPTPPAETPPGEPPATPPLAPPPNPLVPPISPAPGTPIHSIKTNFNSAPILATSTIWFNSHVDLNGAKAGSTLLISGQHVTFNSGGKAYDLLIPDGVIHFSSTVAVASTTWDAQNNRWVTIVPVGYTADIFMTGLGAQIPGGLPGGVKPVNWGAQFTANHPGISVAWQWSAAVYTDWATDPSAIGVKPIDGTAYSPYPNSHPAGTPENMTTFLVSGARGGGASNYSGSWSGTGHATPGLALP